MTTLENSDKAAATLATSAPKKLSLLDKVAFGTGDLASQLVWTTTSSYLAVFYTDMVGLSAASVGLLILLARIVDAFIDPFVGAAAERTQSRFGRFRTWILRFSPVLSILMVLTFMTVPGSTTVKFIYAIVTYGLLGIVYSMVNVPYGSLVTVMTTDPKERMELGSFRMVGMNIGVVGLSLGTMPLILALSKSTDGTPTIEGYTGAVAIFAVVALALFLLVAWRCKEVVKNPTRGVSLKQTFAAVATNKPLMLVFAMMFLVLTGFFGRLGVAVFYLIYNVGRYDLIAPAMALPSIGAIIGIAAFTPMVNRLGKKKGLAISLVGQSAFLVALYLVGWDNPTLVLVLSFFYGVANFGSPIFFGMIPECIDYAAEKTGVRTDGSAFATVSLATKAASAVGGAVGVMAIGAFGFIANQEQSIETLNGINLVTNIFPVIITLLAFIPLALYPLTEKRYAEVRARLDAKTAAGRED
ncbi:glycoside-pentoside-hexuronide (GPH):cation symporter [Demequina sp. SYSU T00192]|uniref:Glycoside-pentoside-hexuronide (GPH):cation symporter n=1 Tax=Demequina litoralis TaxID=3051660 RepID=A0ABT8GAB1_9MICO|nr:glycoside-pentoside-hexuronide (GPH):cation symporter [Demequina sp. SYSU T00192]MDN4476080.1 glycoside-pentoside-hexuronide (GPH):cation symporter [Demequina sp. SYSU T00192]